MSPSHPPTESAIGAADPTRPFNPRALISDLIRTGYCIPDSILLVEGIETQIPVSKRYRTVRLLLGDGQLCIQALLRREMHCFVDSGQVYVGCYVQLKGFEIRSVQLRTDQQGGSKHSGEAEEMVFLVVRDMATVGWNYAYMQMAGTTGPQPANPVVEVEAVASRGRADTIMPSTGRTQNAPAKEGVEDAGEEDEFEVMDVSEQRAKERREEAEVLQERTSGTRSGSTASNKLPWASSDLSKPLKLTPLKSIPNLPYKQNWVVNVLAIVASLSDVEPATLPPPNNRQRTARLADPSTSKQVLLTVFLDPDGFVPKVGSVVLLLGAKNHRFDGGSLKKYGNERREGGTRWWFENPEEVEWCDVEGLKSWWSGGPAFQP